MKVVLLQDVRGVGRRLDVKEVNDGYARNFLIPKKIAAPFNAEGLKLKAEAETKEKNRISGIDKYLKELSENPLKFKLKIGAKGEVYGSVKKEDIEKALVQRGVKGVKAELNDPIKKTGENEIEINFGRGIKEKIKILINERSQP